MKKTNFLFSVIVFSFAVLVLAAGLATAIVSYDDLSNPTGKRALTPDEMAYYEEMWRGYNTSFMDENDPDFDSLDAELSVAECKNMADIIIVGTVEEVYPSRWNTVDGHEPENVSILNGYIVTETLIHVDYYLKDNPELFKKYDMSREDILIATYGGDVGDWHMTGDSCYNFVSGEQVLLFLQMNETEQMTPLDEASHFEPIGPSLTYRIVGGQLVQGPPYNSTENLGSFIKQLENGTDTLWSKLMHVIFRKS
ncbi:hypothetical protein MsAg5_17640 [Methanosarcinaceae archaeon Ag5]|uniref:Uncharacterized protein n=1 Tax=Methanolapillus africanus TaxID=3028297 RepID=A0AAE4SDW5_9EURY|nr:hypothetical protein [Methanosarcinaceae archaeon Ag5]